MADHKTAERLAVEEVAVAPHSTVKPMLVKPKRSTWYHLKVSQGGNLLFIITSLPPVLRLTAEVAQDAKLTIVLAAATDHKAAFSSTVKLVGTGARALEQMGVVGTKESEFELETVLEHCVPHTFGRIISRRVQQDSSFGILRGLLRVAPGALGTDTYLSDKALLVGAKARGLSVPSLEILADDVKASHGATVGQLSPDELFYVQSRGVTRPAAEELLIRAFLEPALSNMPDEFKLNALRF